MCEIVPGTQHCIQLNTEYKMTVGSEKFYFRPTGIVCNFLKLWTYYFVIFLFALFWLRKGNYALKTLSKLCLRYVTINVDKYYKLVIWRVDENYVLHSKSRLIHSLNFNPDKTMYLRETQGISRHIILINVVCWIH